MLIVVVLLVSGFGLPFRFGYIGSSGVRVSREHGLKIPPSAHSFVCGGDPWMHWFSDSGAASALEMNSSELPSFLSQLEIRETHEGAPSIFPAKAPYQIRRPWTLGIPLKTYRCASRPAIRWTSRFGRLMAQPSAFCCTATGIRPQVVTSRSIETDAPSKRGFSPPGPAFRLEPELRDRYF